MNIKLYCQDTFKSHKYTGKSVLILWVMGDFGKLIFSHITLWQDFMFHSLSHEGDSAADQFLLITKAKQSFCGNIVVQEDTNNV